MFKQQNRPTMQSDNENNNQQTNIVNVEKSHETEISTGKLYESKIVNVSLFFIFR
jgi:hypothetical protein